MKITPCHMPNSEEPPKYLMSNNNDGPNTTKYGSLLRHGLNRCAQRPHGAQHAPQCSKKGKHRQSTGQMMAPLALSESHEMSSQVL